MAQNAASAYGRDIACVVDADELLSETQGLGVVRQDAIHRITTDDLIGPGGAGWGYDVRRLLGRPQSGLAPFQPMLAGVLQRDERITAASVVLTATTTRGMADMTVDVTCLTAEGSFRFVLPSVLGLSNATLEAQAS